MNRWSSVVRFGSVVCVAMAMAGCALVDKLTEDSDNDDSVVVLDSNNSPTDSVDSNGSDFPDEEPSENSSSNSSSDTPDAVPAAACKGVCEDLASCELPLFTDLDDCMGSCASEDFFPRSCLACLSDHCVGNDDFGIEVCADLCGET